MMLISNLLLQVVVPSSLAASLTASGQRLMVVNSSDGRRMVALRPILLTPATLPPSAVSNTFRLDNAMVGSELNVSKPDPSAITGSGASIDPVRSGSEYR